MLALPWLSHFLTALLIHSVLHSRSIPACLLLWALLIPCSTVCRAALTSLLQLIWAISCSKLPRAIKAACEYQLQWPLPRYLIALSLERECFPINRALTWIRTDITITATLWGTRCLVGINPCDRKGGKAGLQSGKSNSDTGLTKPQAIWKGTQTLSQVWTKWLGLYTSILVRCRIRSALGRVGPEARRLCSWGQPWRSWRTTESFLITSLPRAGLQFSLEGGGAA